MANHIQNTYWQNVTPSAAIIDNAAATTGEVDTVVLGVKAMRATYLVSFGALDIAVTTCKVQESDTSGDGFADVTGASVTVAATDDNKIYMIDVDLRGRKRYLDLSLTLGDGAAGTYVNVLCGLSAMAESPNTATLRGLGGQAIV